MEKKCQVCGSSSVASVSTLKHYWRCCNSCGSATRTDIKDYEKRFAFRFSHKTLMKHKPPMATSIGKNKIIGNDPSLLFDYMASDRHVQLHKEEYKVFENFIKDVIGQYDVNVNGKRILDISGGNGSFIKEFEKLGARISMTEFNQKSVDFAKERFGIDARKFDFNSDNISSVFTGEAFDLLFLRFALMFCSDLDSFLKRVKTILSPGALVVVNGCTEPSLGTMLRFQYDDYAYLVLYNSEKLKRIFRDNGFVIKGEHTINSKHNIYSWDMHPKVKRLDLFLYRIPAYFKWKNHDLKIRSNVFLFQRVD